MKWLAKSSISSGPDGGNLDQYLVRPGFEVRMRLDDELPVAAGFMDDDFSHAMAAGELA